MLSIWLNPVYSFADKSTAKIKQQKNQFSTENLVDFGQPMLIDFLDLLISKERFYFPLKNELHLKFL